MKFSIIVPVYNVEAYLIQCLESLQSQDYTDFEVICVNDGSTDGSREILAEWETHFPKMRVIDRENGGLSAARNTGLEAAKGDYILFVDSDDWLETNILSTLNNSLNNADMVCFGGWMGTKEEHPTREFFNSGWEYYNQHALKHHEYPFVCVTLRCYRRQFLEENALRFREGILHEDNYFTPLACLAAHTVIVIPNMLYHYRVRPGSIMSTRGLQSRESLVLIGNELTQIFSHKKDIVRTTLYRFLTQCYQMALFDATQEEAHHLRTMINWRFYHLVSRTKFRHRVNYTIQFLRRTFHPRIPKQCLNHK